MSKNELTEFRARLMQDESLQQEMSRALGSEGAAPPSADDVVAFAKARGFEFTAEELREGVPLSDEELDSVAGGVMSVCATGSHFKQGTIVVR